MVLGLLVAIGYAGIATSSPPLSASPRGDTVPAACAIRPFDDARGARDRSPLGAALVAVLFVLAMAHNLMAETFTISRH